MRAIGIIIADTFRQSRSSFLLQLTVAAGLVITLLAMVPGYEQTAEGDYSVTLANFELVRVPDEAGLQDTWNFFKRLLAEYFVGWLGVIVAIVSTAFFLPNMLKQGSVELYLSRPVSRLTVLLGKYLGSLSFVLVLASVVIGGSWLGFGVRTGDFSLGYLMSIPLLVFVFAIVHAVGLVVGVMFRSPLVTMFVSVLFWAFCSGLGYANVGVKSVVAARDGLYQSWLQRVDPGEVRVSHLGEAGARLATRGADLKPHLHTDGLADAELMGVLAAQVRGDSLVVLATHRLALVNRIQSVATQQGWSLRLRGKEAVLGSRVVRSQPYGELTDPTESTTWDIVFKVVEGMYWVFPKPTDIFYIAEELIKGENLEESWARERNAMLELEEAAPSKTFFSRTNTILSNLAFIVLMLALAWWRFTRQDY